MGIPGLHVDLDTKVNTSYVNNGLENSILHQTFGSSLNVSLMLFALIIILMLVGALLYYSVHKHVQRHGVAIRHIQGYLRQKSSQACSAV